MCVMFTRSLRNDVSTSGLQSFSVPHKYIDSLKSTIQVCKLHVPNTLLLFFKFSTLGSIDPEG